MNIDKKCSAAAAAASWLHETLPLDQENETGAQFNQMGTRVPCEQAWLFAYAILIQPFHKYPSGARFRDAYQKYSDGYGFKIIGLVCPWNKPTSLFQGKEECCKFPFQIYQLMSPETC